METRGNATDTRQNNRPVLSYRSCDQCRARKIGCNRASPCSNCVSARVDCTHSTTAPKQPTPKQRVLISAQYERKIDDIASDINSIKVLLEARHGPERLTHSIPGTHSVWNRPQTLQSELQTTSSTVRPHWDHSFYVIDFVKLAVKSKSSSDSVSGSNPIISSLKNLVNTLEDPNTTYNLSSFAQHAAKKQSARSMPALESVLEILRWARAHESYTRIAWVCRILPLDKYEDICRKVYFAIDDYTEIDFIIANSYLSYVFAEHAALFGLESSRSCCQLCAVNLGNSLSHLPLLLPASLEVVAALTLGCLYMIENHKATGAWVFISSALNICQTLGYHRLSSVEGSKNPLRVSQENLFWAVYSFESGLSLRLGRSSSVRDTDITLLANQEEPRSLKVARIQRKAYDHLYSTTASCKSSSERSRSARDLAKQLRDLLDQAQSEITETAKTLGQADIDPMKIVYLYCDLVCESSLLVLILRAITTPDDLKASEDCITVARNTLDLHEQCMELVRGCKDPELVTKYTTWAILHTPFIPYSVVFTCAVQLSDDNDLARLDRFAKSLTPQDHDAESLTHPHRLYELLSQAARLCVDSGSNLLSIPANVTVSNLSPRMEVEGSGDNLQQDHMARTFESIDDSMFDLIDWHSSNQQLMGLLDESILF